MLVTTPKGVGDTGKRFDMVRFLNNSRKGTVTWTELDLGTTVDFMSTKTKEWTPGLVIGLDDLVANQDRALVLRPQGTSTWMLLTTLRLRFGPERVLEG